MHKEWRAKRVKDDGTYEPRPKQTQDKIWIKKNGKTEVDIANTEFSELPLDWQEENLLSAKVAIEKMEDVLNIVHDKWLDRNDSFAQPQQKTQFSRLSGPEKAKDIAILREAIEIMEEDIK